MFSFGGTEILIVVLVALLLFGPDKLPQLAKTIGRFTREFNKYKDILESTVRNEVYRAEWEQEKVKLDKAKADGAAAAAASAASAAATEATEATAEAEAAPQEAPQEALASAPEPAPQEATEAAKGAHAQGDAPVRPPAAVAATSEDDDEEEEG